MVPKDSGFGALDHSPYPLAVIVAVQAVATFFLTWASYNDDQQDLREHGLAVWRDDVRFEVNALAGPAFFRAHPHLARCVSLCAHESMGRMKDLG